MADATGQPALPPRPRGGRCCGWPCSARSSSPVMVWPTGWPRATGRCRRWSSRGSRASRSCRGRSCRTGRSTCSMPPPSSFAPPVANWTGTHCACSARRSSRWPASCCGRCASASSGRPPPARQAGCSTCCSASTSRSTKAPSLHIVLLVVLWVGYAQHVRGAWRVVLHGWAALIGVSVLTTYQHHFVDVPTGLLAGWLCVWLWPAHGPTPFAAWQLARDPRRWRLVALYLTGAVMLGLTAAALGGAALWLASYRRCRWAWWRSRTPASARPHSRRGLMAALPWPRAG